VLDHIGSIFDVPDAMLPDWANHENAIIGSIEQVATALHDYEALGVAHVICNLNPRNKRALALLSQSHHLYRLMEET
jgi:hypothetical protein